MPVDETISRLAAHCRAAQEGYRRAAELTLVEPELAHFFQEQAQTRALAAQALEDRLRASGGKLLAQPLLAPPTEGWSWPADSDETPEAVIASCHRGEERAVRAYEQAREALPEDWRWEVSEQYATMRSALAKLHTWLQGRESQPPRR